MTAIHLTRKGISCVLSHGLPRWCSGKESACQCKRCRFDPWIGKIPWSRKWQLALVFLSEKFHGQKSLASYSPWGCKKSDMTEHTHICTHTHTHTHVLNQIRPSAPFYFLIRDYKCNVLKHDVLGNNKSKSNYPLCYLAHKPVLRKLVKGFTKIKKYNTVQLPLISFNKMNEINLKRNNPSESVLAFMIITFSKIQLSKNSFRIFSENQKQTQGL